MKKDFTILIADRNRNVRKFLQREMTSAGYRVRLAENAHEVIKWTFHHDPLDLIILDPDFPDSDESRILSRYSLAYLNINKANNVAWGLCPPQRPYLSACEYAQAEREHAIGLVG